MPLTRYEIRNEYGLADPELYRAAEKDDPEALLEGVAMAGLVGVLRQLGDLAEFAAEIFHDLHEDVMATAARGHGLMARVQQLEAEFPSVEKAFLTQTDQTPFFTNAGVDWHPNLRLKQNLITPGNLPRFVMESYEECRGPPRLFLLDKFDVSGTGACLKRYTDPSVLKVEAESAVDAQIEKKNRRVKKKGASSRNGETPDVVPTSHAKLHQLFLEERIENGHSDPARLVKLKRRQLNGFPFDPKPGKSYMEKFLGTPSPERKEVHEVSVNSSPLRLTLNSSDEPGPEVVEIGTVSPAKKFSQGLENASPFTEEAELKPVTPNSNEEPFIREIVKVPNPICVVEADKSPYFLHKIEQENGLAVGEERETEGSLDGDGSDDFMSEVDNYMDALTTVESEMETENDYKSKTDLGFLTVGKHTACSDAIEEHLDVRANFSDSQSFGNSCVSDDGKSISRKGRSCLSCSDSLSNLAEHAPSDNEGELKVRTPSVHSVNQGNESTELTYIEEYMVCTAGKTCVPTVNSDVISSAQTELDEIPSDYTDFGSKSSFTDQKGSLTDARRVEELDHNDQDTFVSTADVSDLEEEVDYGSVNKILGKGIISSSHSVTSLVSVNEERQTDYADGICDKEMTEEEVCSAHSVILPSKDQLPISVSPKSNPDLGVTLVSENLDVVQPVQIDSEVSDGVRGKVIGSENLAETVATPELDSIEEHSNADIAFNRSELEHDLIGGAAYPEENANRLEENSRSITSKKMDACTDKLDVEGEDSILFDHLVHQSDKSGSGPVILDDHVDGASFLPSDSIVSNSCDFVNIQEYLGGNIGATPECLMEPEEQKVAQKVEVISKEFESSSHESTSDGGLNQEVFDHIHGSDVTDQTKSISSFSDFTAVPSTESALALDETNSESSKLQYSHCDISDSITEESLEMQSNQHEASSKSYSLQHDKTQERGLEMSVHELGNAAISRNPFDSSAFPGFNLLPENSEEMPPLPPLPPMQWRMGKFQPPSIASPGQWVGHDKGTFLSMQPIVADDKSQFDFPSLGREVANPPNPFMPITSDIPKSQHSSMESPNNSSQPFPLSLGMPTSITDESVLEGFLPLEATESLNPYLNIPEATNEREVSDFVSSGDPLKSSEETSSTEATVATKHYPVSSHGSQTELLNQVIPELTSEETGSSLSNLAIDEQNNLEKSVLPPTTSEDEPGHDLATGHGQTTWPNSLALPLTYEVGKPNGGKLPRPRNPLIDAVAALDKSKLRKVTERIHPQAAPKADERDSLLEQIRTKSFNLKPAAVARPSIQGIQGPKTNLKVAAILEKANAIRQALTGSDEDEDTDGWSDS